MELADIETGPATSEVYGVSFTNISKCIRFGKSANYPILYNVSGECGNHEMMAIMGRSGSGKTTLLQVLAGRVTKRVTGEVRIQGQLYNRTMRSQISYVWQHDIFYPSPSFTVRDLLMFEAYVKMDAATPHEKIMNNVKVVMEQMQIEARADVSLSLLSGGERRRASIAKELLSDPRVLMIDEGTSGLDSAAAYDLLLKLQHLASDKHIPVIAVIHQPSSRAFYLFDHVLVLSEGCCGFRGPPSQCMAFLKRAGFTPPESHCNPADFMLDLLFSQEVDVDSILPRHKLYYAWLDKEKQKADGETLAVKSATNNPGGEEEEEGEPKNEDTERVSKCTEDEALETVTSEQSTSPTDDVESDECLVTEGDDDLYTSQPEYKSSYFRQVYAVLVRSFKAGYETEFGYINILQTIFMAVLAGLCWYQIPQTESRISDLAGYVLFVIAYWFFAGMFEGMLEFLPERFALRRELSSGDYRLSAYFVAKTLASTPVRVLLPWTFVTVSYFLVDAQPSAKVYFSLTLLVVLATLVGNSIGAFIGCVTENYHIATSLTTVVSLSMLIVGGFYLTQLPHWLAPVGYLSAFRYAYRACVQVVLDSDREIQCAGGYWFRACATATDGYIDGTDVAAAVLGKDVEPLNVNIGILVLLFGLFRYLAYLALLWGEHNTLYKQL